MTKGVILSKTSGLGLVQYSKPPACIYKSGICLFIFLDLSCILLLSCRIVSCFLISSFLEASVGETVQPRCATSCLVQPTARNDLFPVAHPTNYPLLVQQQQQQQRLLSPHSMWPVAHYYSTYAPAVMRDGSFSGAPGPGNGRFASPPQCTQVKFYKTASRDGDSHLKPRASKDRKCDEGGAKG
ncbi:hypothetical protein K402DRAFT_69216 [Aulographum hederae CBS 113979]|uniref:Uncharacterized protein n=1 Tax=Aulographum hederae CBS 113979 TaxID=1176131 RepID=A0A6G1HFA7_9PEZI|nr:hypothetical protein K402DRAFT_69216 [Aulographum hederae CBS 113979]